MDTSRACLFSKSSLARLQEFWNSLICLYEIKEEKSVQIHLPDWLFYLPGPSGSGKRRALTSPVPLWIHYQCSHQSQMKVMVYQNNWHLDCLFNVFFRLTKQRNFQSSVESTLLALCEGGPQWLEDFPYESTVIMESIFMSWDHYDCSHCNSLTFTTFSISSSQLISPWTKWPPFPRQYFQMHFS